MKGNTESPKVTIPQNICDVKFGNVIPKIQNNKKKKGPNLQLRPPDEIPHLYHDIPKQKILANKYMSPRHLHSLPTLKSNLKIKIKIKIPPVWNK